MKLLTGSTAIVLLLITLSAGAEGQVAESSETADSASVAPDSVLNRELIDGVIVGDSLVAFTSSTRRSPTGAMLRSMVFPGWGQVYNHKYLKALIVAAGEGYCVVQAVRYWDLSEQAYDLYTETSDIGWFYEYDFYQDRRSLFLWLSGLSIFLSMIDAYVDAHLSNFDVDVTPPFEEPGEDAVTVRVTYRF